MIFKIQVKRLSIIKSIQFHFALPVDSSGMARVQTGGRTGAEAVGGTTGEAQGEASIEE